MVKTQDTRWPAQIVLAGVAAIFTGLVASRALLSAGIITVALGACLHPGFRRHGRSLFRMPMVIAFAALFLIPLISGLWSSDLAEWWQRCQVKLPLLVLPLAIPAWASLGERQRLWMEWIFVGVMAAGSAWSCWHYVQDMPAIHQGYLRAKLIRTPFEDDHIRFSWAVVIAILLLYRSITREIKPENGIRLALVIFFVIYLHILSAKTGLLALYLAALIVFLFRLAQARSKIWLLGLLLLMAVIPFIAYKTLPTFRNRLQYVLYDYGLYSSGNFVQGQPDGARVLALKAGKAIVLQHPVAGLGFGDVWAATQQWYDIHYPNIQGQDRLYPGGEWMMYGCGAGLGAMLVFIGAMITPFFYRPLRNDGSWWALNACAALVMLYEVNLESQIGVLLFSFFPLWWMSRTETLTCRP